MMAAGRVVHCKVEPFDVYIGRPSEWGNPFSHKPTATGVTLVATRAEAIERFRRDLWHRMQADPALVEKVATLHGKTLGCWCWPRPCHGEVLLAAAEWAVGR